MNIFSLLLIALFIYCVYYWINRFKQEKKQVSSNNFKLKEYHKSDPVPEPIPDPEPEKYRFIIPDSKDGLPLVYRYIDVNIIPVNGGSYFVVPGEALSFEIVDSNVYIYQRSNIIGQMENNRLAEMVIDWTERNDPFVGFVSVYSKDDSIAQIALGFYSDLIGQFLKRHPDSKKYKLSGKPDDLAFYSEGNKCDVDYDYEKDKYTVLVSGAFIGVLPAAAVKYASDHETEPEDLDIIVASVDYDLDKDRDIISVYVSCS